VLLALPTTSFGRRPEHRAGALAAFSCTADEREIAVCEIENARRETALLVCPCTVMYGKGQPMEVYEVKTKVGALPEEIVERFWGGVE
jgi:hypothetical protein